MKTALQFPKPRKPSGSSEKSFKDSSSFGKRVHSKWVKLENSTDYRRISTVATATRKQGTSTEPKNQAAVVGTEGWREGPKPGKA